MSVAEVLVPTLPVLGGTVTVAVFAIACGALFVPVTLPVTVYVCVPPGPRLGTVPVEHAGHQRQAREARRREARRHRIAELGTRSVPVPVLVTTIV